jgi:hypothetical protein
MIDAVLIAPAAAAAVGQQQVEAACFHSRHAVGTCMGY